MTVSVTRYATESDIPEIVRVINLAFRVEDFFIDGDRTNAGEIAARIADPRTRIIVIDGDRAISLVAAVVVEVRDERGHFAMFAVDPAVQGRGVSRTLYKAVENHCRESGCSEIDIEIVNLRKELPGYYSRLGFSGDEVAPFPDNKKLRRAAFMIRMTKPLNSLS